MSALWNELHKAVTVGEYVEYVDKGEQPWETALMGTREDCQQGHHTADNQGLCWWCGVIVEQDWWDLYTGKKTDEQGGNQTANVDGSESAGLPSTVNANSRKPAN